MPRARVDLRTVWAVALGAAAMRILLVWGLDLYADEAYYWLWAQRPAAGYFDHPPMVAWIIALSSAVVPGEVGVRILFVACGALAVVFAALIARELSEDPRAAAVGALLAATSPLLVLTGALALPDAPVEAAYAAGTWLVARARGRTWAWAGVAVGLALLSKYTAALLAPALLLLVLWDPELRAELRTRWPWVGAAVSVAFFLPNLLWNAAHGWVAIAFQLRHGFGGSPTVRTFLEFLGGQLAGAGPVVLAAGAWFLARARTSAARRVAAASLVPLLVTVLSALRGPVEANWGALAYPGLAGAAAAALVAARPRAGRALLGASVGLGLLAAAVFAYEVRRPTFAPVDSPLVERFRGWKEYAREARAAVDRACAGLGSPAGCSGADPFVFPGGSYQEAAELAYYAGWRRLGPAQGRPSQLDLWDERPGPGAPFVVLASGEIPPPPWLFRAEGQGRPEAFEVRLQGQILHAGRVVPFARYLGGVPRRARGLD